MFQKFSSITSLCREVSGSSKSHSSSEKCTDISSKVTGHWKKINISFNTTWLLFPEDMLEGMMITLLVVVLQVSTLHNLSVCFSAHREKQIRFSKSREICKGQTQMGFLPSRNFLPVNPPYLIQWHRNHLQHKKRWTIWCFWPSWCICCERHKRVGWLYLLMKYLETTVQSNWIQSHSLLKPGLDSSWRVCWRGPHFLVFTPICPNCSFQPDFNSQPSPSHP